MSGDEVTLEQADTDEGSFLEIKSEHRRLFVDELRSLRPDLEDVVDGWGPQLPFLDERYLNGLSG